MRKFKTAALLSAAILIAVLSTQTQPTRADNSRGASSAFKDDLDFLTSHTEIILLQRGDSAVAVAPAFQTRVMTSTYSAQDGPSFGWLKRDAIAAGVMSPGDREGKLQEHIHVFGGEERFWLGPEGGQFSFFFKPGSDFDFAAWKTPACIDTESFKVIESNDDEIETRHECVLTNWSGRVFSIGIERTVRILETSELVTELGVERADAARLDFVGYRTINTIRNIGDRPWNKNSGMPSIWLLGMYPPSPATTIAIPFKTGSAAEKGPIVNDEYFGKVPSDYLKIEGDIIFMRGDGTYRAKIGIPPARSKGIAGSYCEEMQTLNLILCGEPPEGAEYVNSMWELQEHPFKGDAINAYNDGSPAPGEPPMGPFYELESSSPAARLAPGESLTHTQTTLHLNGPRKVLDRISRKLLNVTLDEIEQAF